MKNQSFTTYFSVFLIVLVAFTNQACTPEPPKNVRLEYTVTCKGLKSYQDTGHIFYKNAFTNVFSVSDSLSWTDWRREKASDSIMLKDESHFYKENGERDLFAQTCLIIDSFQILSIPAEKPDSFHFVALVRGFSRILIVENKIQRSLLKMDASFRFDVEGKASVKPDSVGMRMLFMQMLNKHLPLRTSGELGEYLDKHPVPARWQLSEVDLKAFN